MKYKDFAPYLPHRVPAKLSRQGVFNLDSEYPNENAHKLGYVEAFNCNEEGDIEWGVLRVLKNYSFDFGKGLFNGVQVRAVRWQVVEFRSYGLDSLTDTGDFVAWQVVHDNDVALA